MRVERIVRDLNRAFPEVEFPRPAILIAVFLDTKGPPDDDGFVAGRKRALASG